MNPQKENAPEVILSEHHEPFTHFTFATFMADHAPHLLIGIFCLVVIFPMMRILGISVSGCVVIICVVAFCFAAICMLDYFRKKRFYQNVASISKSAEAAAYFPELIGEASSLEGKILSETVEQMGMLASHEAASDKADMQQYREYVELWIHEAKTPLAAMKLLQSSIHGDVADKLAKEIERLEAQTEQALYYARSTSLAHDYRLRKLDLSRITKDACKKNMRQLIAHDVTITMKIPSHTTIVSDEQWLTFILSQIISNSVKYGAHNLTFVSQEQDSGTPHGHTLLEVQDDGMGIPAADVSKVFERGFTGINGRTQGSSTGMGLYLVASMAKKMGLGIDLASEVGKGTRVIISLPHNRCHDR